MKITFYIIIFIIIFFFITHTQITLKPFSISFPYWHRSVGLLLVFIGILIFNIGELASGYKKGYKDGMDKVIEYLNKKVKED